MSKLIFVLFVALLLLGCEDSGSGTGSIDISENSSESNIIIIEKQSSSSRSNGSNVHCFTIDGRELECNGNLPLVHGSSAFLPGSSSSSYTPLGYFVDTRNNHLYKTVRMGNQIWFAENMNVDGEEYFDATEAANACPPETHLPSEKDWTTMLELYSNAMPEGNDVYYGLVGTMLKSADSWLTRDFGTNELLFDAKAAGRMENGEYFLVGLQAEFWTSNLVTRDSAKIVRLVGNDNYAQVTRQDASFKLSVRCLLDKLAPSDANSSSSFVPLEGPAVIMPAGTYDCEVENCVSSTYLAKDVEYNEVQDLRDGQIYKAYEYGDVVWMVQNMNYARDGQTDTKDSYCGFISTSFFSCEAFGRIYPWNAVGDVCPEGWRLPTQEDYEDWASLLKEDPDFKHAFEIFGIPPVGYLMPPSTFKTTSSRFWTSTEVENNDAMALAYYISPEDGLKYAYTAPSFKVYYLPVRCVKDLE